MFKCITYQAPLEYLPPNICEVCNVLIMLPPCAVPHLPGSRSPFAVGRIVQRHQLSLFVFFALATSSHIGKREPIAGGRRRDAELLSCYEWVLRGDALPDDFYGDWD